MVAMVLLALSSRLQPGEHYPTLLARRTRVRSVTHIQDGVFLVADESVDWMHKHLAFPPFHDSFKLESGAATGSSSLPRRVIQGADHRDPLAVRLYPGLAS